MSHLDPVMSLVFSGEAKWRFLLSMSVTMVMGPIMALAVLKHQGVIDSISMPTLKGRAIAYTVVLFFYITSYVMLMDVGLPHMVYALFYGLMSSILLLAIISIFYKISAHTAAMGGAVALLVWMGWHYGLWPLDALWASLVLAASVASARLLLQVHDSGQVAAGFSLGFLCVFGAMVLMMP